MKWSKLLHVINQLGKLYFFLTNPKDDKELDRKLAENSNDNNVFYLIKYRSKGRADFIKKM